jgi:hypothetical protein
MGVYEGHFRKLERALPASIDLADLYLRLKRIPTARAFFPARSLQFQEMRESAARSSGSTSHLARRVAPPN